jgi:hypothetical protein
MCNPPCKLCHSGFLFASCLRRSSCAAACISPPMTVTALLSRCMPPVLGSSWCYAISVDQCTPGCLICPAIQKVTSSRQQQQQQQQQQHHLLSSSSAVALTSSCCRLAEYQPTFVVPQTLMQPMHCSSAGATTCLVYIRVGAGVVCRCCVSVVAIQ